MRLHQRLSLALLVLSWITCPVFSQTQTARIRTTPDPTASAPKPASAKSKPAPKLTDQQLEAIIKEKFANSKSASKFKVHVQGGVATIEGKTDVIQHKGAATRMARVAGATAVNNKVEVSEAARAKAA